MLYIMYTSGTTGLPKGVVHTHASAIWAILTIAANSDYHDADRYLGALPMFHVGALTPLAVNVYRGATSVVMRSFDPLLAWQLIEREKITRSGGVPVMSRELLAHRDSFSTRNLNRHSLGLRFARPNQDVHAVGVSDCERQLRQRHVSDEPRLRRRPQPCPDRGIGRRLRHLGDDRHRRRRVS